MNWGAIGAIGEFVGAAAVVGTLLPVLQSQATATDLKYRGLTARALFFSLPASKSAQFASL
jgi:hypothetical protein